MALSASLNPLRCGGTALPVPLLLMAKLIAVAFLLSNHVRLLPDPYLPFVPGLDRLLPGTLFQRILQGAFLLGAIGILFNRRVRTSCLLLGGSVFVGVLSSRAYYGNNKTFCALMLLMTALYVDERSIWLPRLQVAVVYLGAGLNKLLDGDWHSGQFFEHWATSRLQQPLYVWLNAMLPPLWMGKLFCWSTIVLELGAAAMLAVPRWNIGGVAFSVMLQSGILLFTGQTFTMFHYGMQAAMFAFLRWPKSKLTVIWDGDCGFCAFSKRWLERLDTEQLFRWSPFQSGEGRKFGIRDEAAMERLHLVTASGNVLSGFQAVRHMLLYFPPFWLGAMVLLAGAPEPSPTWRRLLVGAGLFFFSPLMNPIGSAAYDWVARNRYRLFPNSACAVRQRA